MTDDLEKPRTRMIPEKTYILISDLQLKNCLRYLTEEVTLPSDTQKRPYEVIIKPHVNSLSAQQRGWFHRLCEMISNDTGYTPEEIKMMVKEREWGSEIKTGPDGKQYKFVRSSERNEQGRKTNKVEYGALIEGAYRLGADAGIVLPNPDRFTRGR